MTITVTINSESSDIVEILQTSPPAIVDVAQLVPARVNIIGTPGEQGPPGTDGAPTRVVILPIPGGYGPNTNPATQESVISSAGPTANAPFVEYYQNAYDPDVDQEWFWSFSLPYDYGSGGTLRIIWATKGTDTNPVVWKGATAIPILGTTDADESVFDTVVTASGVPSSTQGILSETTIDLTMANAAPYRPIIVMVGRDADNPSDTNPNVAVHLEVAFEYERI